MTPFVATASTSRRVEIGFDRTLKLQWLHQTLALLRQGVAVDEARRMLREVLSAELGGPEAVSKTLDVLRRLWLRPPEDLLPLRERAVRLSESGGSCELVWHWGMCLAVYPFFRRVAEAAGRLVRLQGECFAGQVQRRMREQLGERPVVARAARHVLRSFVRWNVLQDAPEKGVYRAGPTLRVNDREAAAWLLEATLRGQDSTRARFSALLRSPALFPFLLDGVSARNLATSGVEATLEGLAEEVVTLRAAPGSVE